MDCKSANHRRRKANGEWQGSSDQCRVRRVLKREEKQDAYLAGKHAEVDAELGSD